ncbi:MAG: rod shape-determining protein MreD [Verrucomicrobia bacterium]|nr:MAG: rod shape-determining protein MreD [Verrucomicrobiota bacterium]
MNWLNTILIVAVALLAIFLEATFNGIRRLLGAQIDLLPGLIVYAGLTASIGTVALAAVFSGLCFDAVSANPLGVTVLPLFLVGLVIHLKRQLILRDQPFAQTVLGLAASASVPILTLLIVFSTGAEPLIGWGSVWQWLVMSVGGAAFTPIFFWVFGRVHRALYYQRLTETTFRPDREIERGRF